MVLQGDVSEGRDQVARNEHRDADGQCPAPVPCGREFHQVVCQHEVTREARDVVERPEFVPVADAVEPHVPEIPRVAQHRREHLGVGQQQGHAPYAEQRFEFAARSPFEPCADHGHDQIQPCEHVEVPQRRSVEREIEYECPEFVQRGAPGEIFGVDRRALACGDVIEVDVIKQRQHDRPENECRENASDALAVEAGEAGFHREQQYARHHDEQRHAAAHETARKGSCEECGAVVVELADEGVAAVRKDHQEAGGHAQQVYPADAFAGRGVRVGKSVLHLFVGVNRIFAKIRKKSAPPRFFSQRCAVFYAGTCGSPRPVPPAGQFTTTVGKYSRKSAAARSDCSGVFSCTPASLYSLPIASYL